jgi:hypothetical protein
MWVAPPKILGAHYGGFIVPSFADSGLDAACPPRPGVVSEPIPKALGSAICSSNRSGWIGRIVEKHADRQFTVFVSSSPTPMVCVTKWGTGAAEMRAANHHGKASIDQ